MQREIEHAKENGEAGDFGSRQRFRDENNIDLKHNFTSYTNINRHRHLGQQANLPAEDHLVHIDLNLTH